MKKKIPCACGKTNHDLAPHVTLKELASFMLTLPDDERITMWTGSNDPDITGCLMTKYGRKQGWDFYECKAVEDASRWVMQSGDTVATLENTPFRIFLAEPDGNGKYHLVGAWKKAMKKEYKNGN